MKKVIYIIFLLIIQTYGLLYAQHFYVGKLEYRHLGGDSVEVFGLRPGRKVTRLIIPQSICVNGESFRVVSIGFCCFTNTKIRYLSLPEGLATINECAFESCTSLKQITIPHSVRKIGKEAFAMCTSLSKVELYDNPIDWGQSVFLGSFNLKSSIYQSNVFVYFPDRKATSYIIPDGIKQIAPGAFNGCTNLSSIEIPSSVTEIGSYAFAHCQSLKAINLPNDIISIGDCAFVRCCSLLEIVIPANVKCIGDDIFLECYSLKKIICLSPIPPSIELFKHGHGPASGDLTSPLYDQDRNICENRILAPKALTSSILLMIPKASINLYKSTAGWQDFYKYQSIETNNDYNPDTSNVSIPISDNLQE